MLRPCNERKRRLGAHEKRKWKRARKDAIDIGDGLPYVLSNLDTSKLHACLTVCKSWCSLIKSVYFRNLWCSNTRARESEGGLCVLMSNYAFGNRCDMWKPDSPITCSIKLAGFRYSEVVASAGGLVCVLGKPEVDPEFEKVGLYRVAVGNPLTKEWVEIPSLPEQFVLDEYSVMGFRMEVLGSQQYKVVAQESREEEHIVYVYDSVTRGWSPPRKVFFGKIHSTRHDETWKKMAIYDIHRDTWNRDWIQDTTVTTGLETREVLQGKFIVQHHLLTPYVNMGSFCVWEYNGERFFAAPFEVGCLYDIPGEPSWWGVNDSPGGFGVWKVENGKLQLVSAVWGQEIRRRVSNDETYAYVYKVKTYAFGYLVCFSACNSYFPIVVYNMNTRKWDGVFKVKPDSRSTNTEKYYERRNYLNAVVYRPSLACP